MPHNALPNPCSDWALFLDFDGTLVELAETPDLVRPAARLRDILHNLCHTFDDAVAIVSGRSLQDLDGLMDMPTLAMAGVHGAQRRDSRGRVYYRADQAERLRVVRQVLARFVAAHDGTSLEDKGGALALHYRRAPAAESAATALVDAECRRLGDGFEVQHGKRVLELKPAGCNKGTAVADFLREPPFAGRTPVFVGDDVTDEDAFRYVNRHGGTSIRVGPLQGSVARWRVDSVAELLQWLADLPGRVETAAQGTP